MKAIVEQFEEMLRRGTLPCFEFQTSEDDYLLVNLEVTEEGIEFSFDSDDKPVYFDGDIIVINDNRYIVPFDEYLTDLVFYIERVHDNIVEGFLIPNDLYFVE